MKETTRRIGLAVAAALLLALITLLGPLDVSSALAQSNNPATGAPEIKGAAQLDERLWVCTWNCIDDDDGMTTARFEYQWMSNDGTTDTAINGATSGSYTILRADVGKTLKVQVTFTDDAGNLEELISTPTATVSGQRNSDPTGLPIIVGTAKVGEILSVDISGIADADGLSNLSYGGSWSANDPGDTSSGGYLQVAFFKGQDPRFNVFRRTVGRTLRVSIWFEDDAGKSHSLTSEKTTVVVPTAPAAPEDLAITPNSDGDLGLAWVEPTHDFGGEILGKGTWGDGGSPITGYVVQWKEAGKSWTTTADVSEAAVSETTHTITGLTDGKDYSIRVLAVNVVGRGTPSDEATANVDLPGTSTDATLSALTLSNLDFGTFAPATVSYTAQVANSVVGTIVTPTLNHSRATYVIKLNGVTDDDGTISLSERSNVITVEVTAEDGNTTRTYTVTVTRVTTSDPEDPSTDATLSSLTLSDVDFGTFESDTESYTATVAFTVQRTTVTPTVNHSGATYVIRLDGVADADGEIPLSFGSNTITIEVTAQDVDTRKTYTVTVTRESQSDPVPLSRDATLKALTLSNVDFGAFDPETLSYIAQVDNSVAETTVIPTVNHAQATYLIKLGGVTDTDGLILLSEGSNVITIEVTAQHHHITKTYTVTVTRAERSSTVPLSTDASLRALTLSNVDFGTFDSAKTTYEAQVDNSVAETTVRPTANDSGAVYVIKLNGVEGADGVITLSVGVNAITVEVTAEDGDTNLTYTVTVTRVEQSQRFPQPSSDATLSALTLGNVDFGTFDSAKTSYTAEVENSVTQTMVRPVLSNSRASYVTKVGGVIDADGVVPLSEGSNIITVEVTSQDGSATRIYTVTVTREAVENTELPVATDPCLEDLGSLAMAVTRNGTWADDCPSESREGRYARYYSFTLSQESHVTIGLTSTEDTYLFLLQGSGRGGTQEASNDDVERGVDNSSRISASLAAGIYTVEATTYNTAIIGDFTLTATPVVEMGTSPGSTEQCAENLGGLSATVSRSNSWTDECSSDNRQGRYARYYSFSLSEETEVTIDLSSAEDTYLYLLNGSRGGTEEAQNDDIVTNTNRNSRIVATLATGIYTIEATTYNAATTGNFTLTVTPAVGMGTSSGSADHCLEDLGSLAMAVTRNGSWTDECSSESREGRYARYYSFTLGEESQVTIDLTSNVDTYLFLLEGAGREGSEEGNNDDIEVGVNTDSRILSTLAAGTYTIEATTYNAATTGNFTLTVTPAVGMGTPSGSTDQCVEALGSLTAAVTRSGTWSSECISVSRTGRYAQYYSFTVSQETEVTIDLTSNVDTYLFLLEGAGREGSEEGNNDDIEVGVNTDSRILSTLAAGTYTIEATTYNAATTGNFTLTVTPAVGMGTPSGSTDQCVEALGSLTAAVTRSGTWSSECISVSRTGRYAQYYSFTVSQETEVTIDLTSNVDTYLFLLEGAGREGSEEGNNDDIEVGVNTDSRILSTLAAGTYTIEATTYNAATTGNFTLKVALE